MPLRKSPMARVAAKAAAATLVAASCGVIYKCMTSNIVTMLEERGLKYVDNQSPPSHEYIMDTQPVRLVSNTKSSHNMIK